VHLAFSSASVVGSMTETIAATPTISVPMNVNSAKMISSYVGRRTLSDILFVAVVEECIEPGILGSICTWLCV